MRFRFHAAALALAAVAALGATPASAQTLNAYSIWPENWAKPMFEEFEKATGIKVNFVRFSSGEALARTEGVVAFPALLAHYARIEPQGPEPDWINSLVFRGMKRLPVRVTRAR